MQDFAFLVDVVGCLYKFCISWLSSMTAMVPIDTSVMQ